MHQQCAQIAVAALADALLADASTGAGLAWHQPGPGRELTAIGEGCGRTHGGHDRGGREDPDAGYLTPGISATRRQAGVSRKLCCRRCSSASMSSCR